MNRTLPRLIHHLADNIDGLRLFARHRKMLIDETRKDAFACGDKLLEFSAAVFQHLHRSRLTWNRQKEASRLNGTAWKEVPIGRMLKESQVLIMNMNRFIHHSMKTFEIPR